MTTPRSHVARMATSWDLHGLQTNVNDSIVGDANQRFIVLIKCVDVMVVTGARVISVMKQKKIK